MVHAPFFRLLLAMAFVCNATATIAPELTKADVYEAKAKARRNVTYAMYLKLHKVNSDSVSKQLTTAMLTLYGTGAFQGASRHYQANDRKGCMGVTGLDRHDTLETFVVHNASREMIGQTCFLHPGRMRILAVLRKPVDRVVSLLYYVNRVSE